MLFLALILFAPVAASAVGGECIDFLTITQQGYARLPLDAFDDKTRVYSMRVRSAHSAAFVFPNGARQDHFYIAEEKYTPRSSEIGSIYYKYTAGPTDYYFNVSEKSVVTWFCQETLPVELSVRAVNLEGSFYLDNGTVIQGPQRAIEFSTNTSEGFEILDLGTTSRVYVAAGNASSIEPGRIILQLSENQYFTSQLSQVRFAYPSTPSKPFCRTFSEQLCVDAGGLHQGCSGKNLQTYQCVDNRCAVNENRTVACEFGCSKNACEKESTALPTATPTSTPKATTAPTIEPTVLSPATTEPQPTYVVVAAQPSSNNLAIAVAIGILIAAAALYLLWGRK